MIDKKEIIDAFNNYIDCTKQCSKARARLRQLGISANADDYNAKVEIRLWNGIDQLAEMLGKTTEEYYDILNKHEKKFKHKGIEITQKPKLREEYYLPIREVEEK